MPGIPATQSQSLSVFFQAMMFRLRTRVPHFISSLRKFWWRLQGMQVGAKTTLGRITLTWPNQLKVGSECAVLPDVTIDYCHGIWRPGPSITIGDRCYIGRSVEFNVCFGVAVGNDCLVAAGCRFIDHDHGIALNAGPMKKQDGPGAPIVVEDDVWLGANVIVLKGVTIGRGAVVAAAAVVTKSIPQNEIWAGIPARRIGLRE